MLDPAGCGDPDRHEVFRWVSSTQSQAPLGTTYLKADTSAGSCAPRNGGPAACALGALAKGASDVRSSGRILLYASRPADAYRGETTGREREGSSPLVDRFTLESTRAGVDFSTPRSRWCATRRCDVRRRPEEVDRSAVRHVHGNGSRAARSRASPACIADLATASLFHLRWNRTVEVEDAAHSALDAWCTVGTGHATELQTPAFSPARRVRSNAGGLWGKCRSRSVHYRRVRRSATNGDRLGLSPGRLHRLFGHHIHGQQRLSRAGLRPPVRRRPRSSARPSQPATELRSVDPTLRLQQRTHDRRRVGLDRGVSSRACLVGLETSTDVQARPA